MTLRPRKVQDNRVCGGGKEGRERGVVNRKMDDQGHCRQKWTGVDRSGPEWTEVDRSGPWTKGIVERTGVNRRDRELSTSFPR